MIKPDADIPVTRCTKSRIEAFDVSMPGFGHALSDHMFVSYYEADEWRNAQIEPVHNFSLSPIALCLHYGQTVFEGMKAYRMVGGEINIFRLDKHHERFNRSLERMCMPAVPKGHFEAALIGLVELENKWISEVPGQSLYIRPFMFATEPKLGVKVSDSYTFAIVCSPMTPYFSGNIKVKVEMDYARAMIGGAGFAKNGGNYGAALYPTRLARKEGFDEVLWTDAMEHRYIEESGVMNVMIVIDGILITPALNGTILDGITRDSLLTLARDAGICVEERRISYDEIETAFKDKRKVEAFGVGTAAVLTPIELINIEGRNYYPDVSVGGYSDLLRNRLHDIRTGTAQDVHSWNHRI